MVCEAFGMDMELPHPFKRAVVHLTPKGRKAGNTPGLLLVAFSR